MKRALVLVVLLCFLGGCVGGASPDLEKEVRGLKSQVSEAKKEVAQQKEEVAALKQELAQVKKDLDMVKAVRFPRAKRRK